MIPTYRFYSFVAGNYLSQLQRGLQTAHAVSEMKFDIERLKLGTERGIYDKWAEHDKTIIICDAGNHKGVMDASEKLHYYGYALGLPVTIFREDEDSMNSMATATAIIVPDHLYDVAAFPLEVDQRSPAYQYVSDGEVRIHAADSFESEFISFLKSFRLVQS